MSNPIIGEEQFKAVMRPYIVFLMDKINRIYYLWAEHPNEPRLALEEALRTVNFLPRSLKKALKKDAEKIGRFMEWSYAVKGHNWLTTELKRNRVANRVASLMLQPFVDKMINELDKRGYLERGSLAPKFPSETLGIPE